MIGILGRAAVLGLAFALVAWTTWGWAAAPDLDGRKSARASAAVLALVIASAPWLLAYGVADDGDLPVVLLASVALGFVAFLVLIPAFDRLGGSEPAGPAETRPRRSAPSLRTILLVAGGLVLAFLPFRAPDNRRPELQALIGTAADTAGRGGTIDLATIGAFAWDRVYAFSAYSELGDIKNGLGFDWAPASAAETAFFGDLLLASDELDLLVYVRGDREVTGWLVLNAEHREPFIRVDAPADFGVYSRTAAEFTVTDDHAMQGIGGRAWQLTPVDPAP